LIKISHLYICSYPNLMIFLASLMIQHYIF